MTRITTLRSSVSKPEGKNYQTCELAYKTEDGKTKGMKLLSFTNPENFKVASQSKPGDVLDASFQQNTKGFWEFASLKSTGETAVAAGSAADAGASKAAPRSGGNWETSEERAARQVMIVRQSSLSTAVNLKPKASVEEIIAVAQQFEAFVMGKGDANAATKQFSGEIE